MASDHTLLSLALNDGPSVQSALTVESEPGTGCALDPRTVALVRLAVFAPVVGIARVVAAAPALASAIGYDIDSALEKL